MTLFQKDETKLSSLPNLKTLLLKAAFKKSRYNMLAPSEVSLPSHDYYFDGVKLEQSAYNAFHQVVG